MPWTLNLVMSMSPFVAGKLSPGKTPWMLRAAGPSISSRSALVAQASRSAINNVNLNEKLRWRANQKSQSDSDNKLGMRNNAFSSGPPAEEEYKVGPGRPPKEHQFKPGQSGNPTGAKRKAPSLLPDLKEQFERAFNQTGEAWDGAWRGFRGDPAGQSGIAVTPARYAAFLAEARRPLAADPIMGRRDERNDPHRTFLFPVHKLFEGKSCVAGATITLDFIEYHRNEKLKRIHSAGGVKVARGFDIEKPPFVRDSKNTDDLVALHRVGASVLVVAQQHDQLVRTAEQKNSVSRKKEVVRFVVPPGTTTNRFSSSLQLPTSGAARIAPEFVNIRHRVVQAGISAGVTIDDMQLLPEAKFNVVLKAGKYEAVHFIDDTCDGVVAAVPRTSQARRAVKEGVRPQR